jgi:hypothetical protein
LVVFLQVKKCGHNRQRERGPRERSSGRCRNLRLRYRSKITQHRKKTKRNAGTIGEGGGKEGRRVGERVKTAERRNTNEDSGKCRKKAKRIKEKKV